VRRYLQFRVNGNRRALEKLLTVQVNLEDKFVQQDKKQHDLAVLKAQTKIRLAKAKLSKVEAEKSKARTVHYQDPMDVDNDEPSASADGSPVLRESPALAGTFIKILTKETQEIRKSHMVGAVEQPHCTKSRKLCFFSPLPHPPYLNLCYLSSLLR
jgi:hypothetical protein